MRKRASDPKKLRTFLAVASSLIILFSGVRSAQSETDRLRIAQQFGIAYLPLIVASEKSFIEEEARKLDIKPPTIEWLRLSGAAAMNEALISGSLDFATAGITPMILTWDKTRTTAKIIGVAALGSMANVLTTNNPKIKTIADFTSNDRIALPLRQGRLSADPAPDGCRPGLRKVRQAR